MWTRQSLRNDLLAIFKAHAPEGHDVTETSTVTGDLELDSLGVMEVVAEIEDRFGLTLPDDALPQLRTVGDVARGLEERLGASGRLS